MEELRKSFSDYLSLVFGSTKYIKVEKMLEDFFRKLKKLDLEKIKLCDNDCEPMIDVCPDEDTCLANQVYLILDSLTLGSTGCYSAIIFMADYGADESFSLYMKSCEAPLLITKIAEQIGKVDLDYFQKEKVRKENERVQRDIDLIGEEEYARQQRSLGEKKYCDRRCYF